MPQALVAGAASVEINPTESLFLFGYPHVKRYSTGIHDPLLSCALYLSDGQTPVIFVANDVIAVSKDSTRRVRERISRDTGVPAGNILLSATHTHSAPSTADWMCNESDPVVPKADLKFIRQFEDAMVKSAVGAYRSAQPAMVGLAIADGTGCGTNRHNPAGLADQQVPVLVVKSVKDKKAIAAMLVYAMHPTVLHENSTLISGDFPAMSRKYIQHHVLGAQCVVLHHMGAAGDQSPRHVTKANTFAEAERLGQILGKSVRKVVADLNYVSDVTIGRQSAEVQLPVRTFPDPAQAKAQAERAHQRLEKLQKENAPRTEVRTAECDTFGAEETLTLANAAKEGRLAKIAQSVMPAEVQVIDIGPWTFVAWPGETFVDFALQVRKKHPNAFVITMANGETQGYMVTQEAIDKNWYEATNAVFQSPQSPQALVDQTLKLIGK
jgi:hypothetical protein